MAQLHLAGSDFPAPPHPRGPDWIATTAARVMPFLSAGDAAMLAAELACQREHTATLPGGVIHADLFRDNVLFTDDSKPHIGGLLDFYFAGRGDWLFDLAIVANDWCGDADATLDRARTTALLSAYAEVRPFNAAEHAAWPWQLRAAALRFWLSRLEDFHCPQPGEDVTVRDPVVYRRILAQRITGNETALSLASLLA